MKLRQRNINKFLLALFIFFVPVFLTVLIYLLTDPFKVLYSYDNYYPENNQYVMLNRDVVSTTLFLENYKRYNYDSFIFGNSRAIFYERSYWQKYIPGSAIFFFDASGESLYGIYRKVQLIHNKKVRISNCLLILDASILEDATNKNKEITDIKHYMISESSKAIFQFQFLKAFFDPRFLVAFLDYRIFREQRKYMLGILEFRQFIHDLKSNELKFDDEKLNSYKQKKNFNISPGNAYTAQSKEPLVSAAIIKYDQIRLLLSIKNNFNYCKTNYKIIISPLYDQIKLNEKDVLMLKTIFGFNKVYDFSGKNQITSDYRNYYEASHYKPFVARIIIDSVYKGNH